MDWSNPTIAAIAGAIVGALIGALSTGVVLHMNKTRRRMLVVQGVPRSLFSMDSKISDRVSVQLDGEAIENLHDIEFTVINNGNAVLENPKIKIAIEECAKIIDVEVDGKHFEEDDQLDGEYDDYKISFSPLYMNPSDRFVIRLMVSGDVKIKQVSYRNKGVYGKLINETIYLDTARDVHNAISNGPIGIVDLIYKTMRRH